MSGHNYRTGQNVCSVTCPVEHIDLPGRRIKKPLMGWPDIRGLNSLQLARDEWLNYGAIEVAIRAYHSGLPKILQDRIDIQAPEYDSLFAGGKTGAEALRTILSLKNTRLYNRFKRSEYSIWPINTNGNHWVTVVLHKQQRPTKQDKKKMEWSHITQMAIIDPFRSAPNQRMVNAQMRRFLENDGNFTFAPGYERTVWGPLQRDTTSCGPRSYWCAKQIMDRLLELHEDGIDYDESIWNDLSGWFNEDFIRGEMIGRNAWDGVRAMDYNARLAIEIVNQVKKYGTHRSRNAGEAMKPWTNSNNKKPEKRPWSASLPSGPWSGPRAVSSTHLPDTIVIDDDDSPATKNMWHSPALTPNKHRIVPSLSANTHEIIVIEDGDPASTKTKGPVWPSAARGPNPFIPPPQKRPLFSSSAEPTAKRPKTGSEGLF
ncbi:hypothetical protein F5Y19DRAFT_463300 [Xylariaceae sp. FL1651]|nr:hypothetical protein F5Y19DRAFT_463300 [Xylariaceae sp. FL1651]